LNILESTIPFLLAFQHGQAMQLPPAVKSFFKQNSFKGKTIVPFNTNAGYGVGTGIEEI